MPKLTESCSLDKGSEVRHTFPTNFFHPLSVSLVPVLGALAIAVFDLPVDMSYAQATPRIKGGRAGLSRAAEGTETKPPSLPAGASTSFKHIVTGATESNVRTNLPPSRSLLHQGISPVVSLPESEVRIAGLNGIGRHSAGGPASHPSLGQSSAKSLVSPLSRSRRNSNDAPVDALANTSPFARIVFQSLNRRCAIGLAVFSFLSTMAMCLLAQKALYWKMPLYLFGVVALTAFPWLVYWKRVFYSKDSLCDTAAFRSAAAPRAGNLTIRHGNWTMTPYAYSVMQLQHIVATLIKHAILQAFLTPIILVLWSRLNAFEFGSLWLHPDGLYGKPMLHPNIVLAVAYSLFLSLSLSASIVLKGRYKVARLPSKSKGDVYGCPRLFIKGVSQAFRGDADAKRKVYLTLLAVGKYFVIVAFEEVSWAVCHTVLFSSFMYLFGESIWRVVTLLPSLLGQMADSNTALLFWRRWCALQGPGPLDVLRLLAFQQIHMLPGSSLPLIKFALGSSLLLHGLMRLAHALLAFVVFKWPLRIAATHEKRILFPLLDGLGPMTAPSRDENREHETANVVHLLPLYLAWRDMAMVLQTSQPELASLLRSPLYADWEGKPWHAAKGAWSAASVALLDEAKARAKFLDWATAYFDIVLLPNRPVLSMSDRDDCDKDGPGLLAFFIGGETAMEVAISRDYASDLNIDGQRTQSVQPTLPQRQSNNALFDIIYRYRLWLKRVWPARTVVASWIRGQVHPSGDDALQNIQGLPSLTCPLLLSSHQVMTEFVVHSYKEDTYGIVQRDLITFLRESLAWMQLFEREMERALALTEGPRASLPLSEALKRAFPWLGALLPGSDANTTKSSPWAVLYRAFRKNLATVYVTFEADLKSFGLNEQEFNQWKTYSISSAQEF